METELFYTDLPHSYYNDISICEYRDNTVMGDGHLLRYGLLFLKSVDEYMEFLNSYFSDIDFSWDYAHDRVKTRKWPDEFFQTDN